MQWCEGVIKVRNLFICIIKSKVMSVIIGIHLGHDASIALVKDGRLVATSAVERWSRYKKDMFVQREHLELILRGWNLKIKDIFNLESRIYTLVKNILS